MLKNCFISNIFVILPDKSWIDPGQRVEPLDDPEQLCQQQIRASASGEWSI
jgi:hypothetical protein